MSNTNCEKHPFEVAENTCAHCNRTYCGECLVYSFGPKKPPFCIPCAVAAAGIRTTSAVRPLNRPMNRPLPAAQPERPKRSFFRRSGRDQVPVTEPVAARAPKPAPESAFDHSLIAAPSMRPVEDETPVWNGDFDWEPAQPAGVD